MLPETVNRRLERWTNKLAGASWPAWGGHVTLVPSFVEKGNPGDVRAALVELCVHEEPFTVRFGPPLAVADATRPDYYAVFLTVDSTDADELPNELNGADAADQQEVAPDAPLSHLHRFRQRLLDALAHLREDVRPQLLEQEFLPHVTLALGLGEAEANQLVREIRAEPLTATFYVEVIWLVTQTFGEGARFERDPIALGRVAPVEIMRD